MQLTAVCGGRQTISKPCVKPVSQTTYKQLAKTPNMLAKRLPTYPSPKPTFCPKGEASVNVGLGNG